MTDREKIIAETVEACAKKCDEIARRGERDHDVDKMRVARWCASAVRELSPEKRSTDR